MTDSLRDQLLGLGFKPAPKPERAPKSGARPSGHKTSGPRHPAGGPSGQRSDAPRSGAPRPGGNSQPGRGPNERGSQARGPQGRAGAGQADARKPGAGRPGQGRKPQSREDIDLAKAYAIRAQREKDERIAAEAAKQEEARLRREARARLAELVKGQALNAADAEIARHFPYGGKIKRIYVTEAQLKALNAGELGVLQMDGRYVLVTAQLVEQAEQVFAPAVALKVDPNATPEEDPYADPKYQVPDDLVW